jgi:hypothetical protein
MLKKGDIIGFVSNTIKTSRPYLYKAILKDDFFIYKKTYFNYLRGILWLSMKINILLK